MDINILCNSKSTFPIILFDNVYFFLLPQIVITFILITIEIFIVLGMLVYEPPKAVNSYPTPGVVSTK